MESGSNDRQNVDSSLPPPPGVDNDENDKYDRRHQKYDSRSRSRDYDRDRSRRDRGRESRFDRDGYKSHGDDHRNSYHDKDYRESSKESSVRNRDSDYRDRRSYRDRSRDRSRDREKDRSRDRNWGNNDMNFRDDIPNSTILIKGMPFHITEEDIRTEINRFTLYPQEISLKRKKTGESRGFAFVEFRMLSDAVRWKELTQSAVYFGHTRATLHYFVPRDLPDRIPIKADWTCIKCGVNNFRKRDLCFKCNAPRDEAELSSHSGEGHEEMSNNPSSTLLFRNLDILTTEERVLSMLGQITVLPIKNLKVAKDTLTNTSRGFAFVELHSISEAMQLYDLLLSMKGNFFVDGRRVSVSYSRKSLTSLNCAANANAASVALAAAQWTNQETSTNQDGRNMFSDSMFREKQMESVQSLNAGHSVGYDKSTPDVSSYQYDETSGYYYDAATGYYYDPNSQYYYNSETRQYLYWDLEKQSYMVVPSSDGDIVATPAVVEGSATKAEQKEVVITSPPVIAHAPVLTNKKDAPEKPKDKINSQDKVKIAKKVAKDMEKWAKTLNQKKENAKLANSMNFSPKPVEIVPAKPTSSNPAKTDAFWSVDEESEKSFQLIKDDIAAGLVAEYGGESDSEAETEVMDEGTKALEILRSEEAKLTDWEKLACLLCKRQFPSKEVLIKHIQMSDLHKQNVDMLKLTKLTPRQLKELEKKESGYRDRAKERRQKFGQPDLPPPSRLKAKYLKERKDAYMVPEQPTAEAIGSDNIGNKMLKAMGWSEGQGLGKTGQGMSGIIEVQRRVKSAGLGMKGASYGASASDSYKDAVRKSMQARYNEIA